MKHDPACFVVFEDPDVLVVEKVAGVLTMGQSPDEPSVLSAVYDHLRASEHGSSASTERPFVAMIGRLDHPVSGLVLCAKNRDAANDLWAQIESRSISKTYHAVVSGKVEPTEAELENWIVRSPRRRHVQVVAHQTHDALYAKLTYKVLQFDRGKSLLEVVLQTGRKHQIRAQLAHCGYPIIGDRKYGSQIRLVRGIGLICKSIVFRHPRTGRRISLECDYPESWCTLQ